MMENYSYLEGNVCLFVFSILEHDNYVFQNQDLQLHKFSLCVVKRLYVSFYFIIHAEAPYDISLYFSSPLAEHKITSL